MAGEEDTPMRTEEPEEGGSGSGGGSEDEEEQVEWLATTREKRATAGNRLRNLLEQEDPEDELELLFAEADDDAGFEDNEADSDVQMDSSDDDEDQGPAAGDDDLEGERELQKQAKAEKAKKRKLEGGMPKIFKKRVKTDPTIVSQAPPPRPKKKSERISWIPTAEDAPIRASARGTTRQSKQQLHMQMVDREVKRLKQLANMEKAAAAKEAAKKPALTQADRLKEAERVEKANSKSLSRWEQAEQEREEEQRAKLAALHDRTLEGPVITWWSGLAEWVGGKLRKVGKNLTIEDKEKPTRKRKAAEMEESETVSVAGTVTEAGPSTAENQEKPEEFRQDSAATAPNTDEVVPHQDSKPESEAPTETVTEATTASSTNPTLSAANPTPPAEPPAPPTITPIVHAPPRSLVLAPPAGLPLTAPPPPIYMQTTVRPQFASTRPALDGSAPLPGLGYNFPLQPPRAPSSTTPFALNPSQPAVPEGPPPPPAIEHGAVNYLILENFDETAIKDKNVQTQILFNRKFVKLPRSKASHEVCAITGYSAKYRDPSTGLAYCNQYAYKEIQRLKRGDYRWSKLVGAYVGLGTYAARGVPDRFREALVKPNVQQPAAN